MGKKTLIKNNGSNNLDDIKKNPEFTPREVIYFIDEVLSEISEAGFPVFVDNVS